MPRKTKEAIEEKAIKKQKLNKKIDSLEENVSISVDIVDNDKKTTKKAKSASTKSTTAKVAKAKKTSSKSETKTTEKTQTKKETSKRTPKAKSEDKESSSSKKATKVAKTSKSKKESSTKSTTKKVAKSSTKATTTKTATRRKSSATAKSTSKSTKTSYPAVVEYYDLPYKYNQTVVKILYQNPTTLFVYWEISDFDIENYKKIYGDNFFETTRPVLIVHNETMNYSFEVDINDFANSWYFSINDSKCNYRVELVRKPVYYNEKIKTDYVHITSSNKIESPNDRILFSTNEPYTVYFKNTKNNAQRKVNLPKLLKELNLSNTNFGFPIVRNVYDLYKNIYHIEDIAEFSISLTNPSSGNPSSHSLSSRFTY